MHPPGDLTPELVPEVEMTMRQCIGWLHADPPPAAVAPPREDTAVQPTPLAAAATPTALPASISGFLPVAAAADVPPEPQRAEERKTGRPRR